MKILGKSVDFTFNRIKKKYPKQTENAENWICGFLEGISPVRENKWEELYEKTIKGFVWVDEKADS